ncbi:Hypothetical protein I5071_53920 [Sandaracinus amylolyticus]|nr:Hypothetical protein I5071_53920 [Sandaracinus amylolyticus]
MLFDETQREEPRRTSSVASWVLRTVHSPDRGLPPEIAIGRVPLAIGRAPQRDGALVIADPRMSRTHATIALIGAKAPTIVDSSSNGTFVDGERVSDAILVDGSVLRAGDTFFVVREVPASLGDADIPDLVGRAPAMAKLREAIALVAKADASVLVIGESGTGKELVARAIHARSGREGPLVAVNCAAIPESLADSTLFGHVAGAFTGAKGAHDGVLRRADRGTIFLDEIAETPPSVQARLLRVLEERVVTPVGGERAVPIDVRVVAATHVELRSAVERGAFRGDLYARLSDLTLRTPPLRERREDVLPILARGLGPDAPPLAPDLVDALLTHELPFNVRELLKIAAELRLRGKGREVLDRALVEERFARPSTPPVKARTISDPPSVREPIEITREHLEELVRETGGNVSELARRLGRSRRQVRRYLDQYGLRDKERDGDDQD